MRRNRADWAQEGVIARLGLVRDSVIAAEIGVTRQRIEQMRKKLGIPSFGARNALPQELVELLGTASDRELAVRFGVEQRRVLAARRSHVIVPYRLIGPLKINHGTRYAYSHHFCRCTPCTAVNAADQSALRQRNPKRFEATRERSRKKVLATAPHKNSNISKYTLGCRCDGCVKAAKEYRTAKHKRSRTTSLQWGGVLVRPGGATLT